jgi:proline iminopeptidase
MRSLYDPVEPFESGHLDVGDGHAVYYERCGDPGRPAALYIHGGPGGGIEPKNRGYFDPEAWQAVLFEQRGSGRSTPFAELRANTTRHLVADMERLRIHCGIERWLLFGGSWGATLALAYAQAHPGRVAALVLRGVFLGSAEEIRWLYEPEGAARFAPDAWEGFLAPIPVDERHDLLGAYHRRLFGESPEEREACARAWSTWEMMVSRLRPDPAEVEVWSAPEFSLSLARIGSEFFVNGCWLEPDQLLRGASRLAGIPGHIIQGRYDLVCPPAAAWALHRAWPGSTLEWVADAGHSASEPGITDALVRATDRMRP